MRKHVLTWFILIHIAQICHAQLAPEPSLNVDSISIVSNKTFRVILQLHLDTANSCDGYLILRKSAPNIIATPVDGKTYKRGDIVGDAQVISSDSNTIIAPNNIQSNTAYYFAVFAFNGNGTSINYNSTNIAKKSLITPSSMAASDYYKGISPYNNSFISDLHRKLTNHRQQSYYTYANQMVHKFIARDTVNNKRAITCDYSGEIKMYDSILNWTNDNFSREHTYPKSWMPSYNTHNFELLPEYSDYHSLLLTNQSQVNAVRSNYPLGEVKTISEEYLSAKLGANESGNIVYEPRGEIKGNVARAIMYQLIRYKWTLPDSISYNIAYGQEQKILKQWHFDDPPDNKEIARNDYIDSLQGNRNPFIDNPNWACYIDFDSLKHILFPPTNCYLTAINTIDNKSNISISPNPNNGKFELKITDNKTTCAVRIKIVNMNRLMVYEEGFILEQGNSRKEILLGNNCKPGSYIVNLSDNESVICSKIVIIQ